MVNAPNNLPAQFSSPDEEVRLAAVSALREEPDLTALRYLEQALGDVSWRVRKASVELLRGFRDRDRVSALLIKALGDEENAGRRAAAVEALVGMGREGVPYLLREIAHPDPEVKKFIVDILGEIKDPAAVDAILPLTRDPAENIRLASVETLGAIGGSRAYEALIDILVTDDVSLQFGVLYALGRIGKPIPLPRIQPLLEKRILRRAIYDALGQTRSPEAVALIAEGLLDSAKSTRQAAVRALYQLGSEPGLETEVERTVRERLRSVPLSPFADFLEANHLQTKRAAIKLLSLVGTPEAIQLLVAASHDDTVQSDIAEAIEGIKSERPREFAAAVAENKTAVSQILRPAPTPAPGTLSPMSQPQFLKVRDIVARQSGMFYEPDLKYLVERRVQRRMEVAGSRTYDEYLKLIESAAERGRDEQKKLINALSTNETYFFREDFQLKAFQEEILPALKKVKEAQGSRRIKLWSAGCSSGEEPYTVAILIKESQAAGELFQYELIGSDINDEVIEQARRGLYSNSSFRATPPGYLKAYFTAEGTRLTLHDEIRRMVTFDDTNIMNCVANPRLRNLDLIFCRNVIIYFSPEAKRRVVDQFYELLNPGGYLLLGHSESLMSISTRFELIHLKHDMVYRKPREGR